MGQDAELVVFMLGLFPLVQCRQCLRPAAKARVPSVF